MGETDSRSSHDSCYEIYYIKEAALRLLLAGLGQHEWYGLFSDLADGQDRTQHETVNEILVWMYQNKIIDWDGEGVVVRQPYADMLSVMLEKKKCVTVRMPKPFLPVRCCYLSDTQVIMTQKSQREEHTLGMAQTSLCDWLRLLEASCSRLEEEESCTLTSGSSISGVSDQTVRIYRYGLRGFRIVWDKGGGGQLRCMQEEFGTKLRELLCTDDPQGGYRQ